MWINSITKAGNNQKLTVQFLQWVNANATTPGTVDTGSYLEPYLIR